MPRKQETVNGIDSRVDYWLHALNTPTRVIGIKMGRTPAALYKKASQEGISLKPTNQSPNQREEEVRLAIASS